MTEPEDKYSDFLILGGSHMLWLSGTHSGQDQRTRIHFFLRSSHSFMSGPEDQGSYVLIVRALLQDLWGTSSGQDQRTRINFFLFFERQSLIYDRTRGPGLICFDCEALLQGRTRGPGSNFLIFLKDSHSFMTGPKDQGSYVLIMRHYFRGGPEDQEPDFDFLWKTVTHFWQDQRTRDHIFRLWGTTSGQDQRTRILSFMFLRECNPYM